MKLFSSNKPTTFTITDGTIIRALLITFAALLFWHFLGKVTGILELIGISAFLAIALNPAVSFLGSKLRLKNRIWATGLAYIVVLVVLAGLLIIIIPPQVKQTTSFIHNIPQTINNFQHQDSAINRAIHRYKLDKELSDINTSISNRVKDFSGPVLSTAGKIGRTIAATLTVLVLTFMMLVEGPLWLKRLKNIQPPKYREQRARVANRMYRVVTGYVNGQVLVALIAAVFASIALFVGSSIAGVTVNIPALAGIVFIFGLIPLIGNTIAAILVCLFCLFASTGLAIGMIVYFIVYQQIENATLQPYIQSRNNQLTPLIVFIAALLGASVAGLLGALAAIPLAGCLRVLFDEYIADHLPDDDDLVSQVTRDVKNEAKARG